MVNIAEFMALIPEYQKKAEETENRLKNIEILVSDNHKLLIYLIKELEKAGQFIKLTDEMIGIKKEKKE